MLKLLSFIILVFSFSAKALHFPPPLTLPLSRSEKGIFVDFIKANYRLHYNLNTKKVSTYSKIVFDMPQEGVPLFDLIPEPRETKINGELVTVSSLLIEGITTLRVADRTLTPGRYTMEMEHEIVTNLTFNFMGEVRHAFWMSDLDDRNFLEQYLPTNFEYDQYQMEIDVKMEGADKEYDLITNGKTTKRGKNEFNVIYPDYFNASSLFYHLMPLGSVPKISERYKTLDGREIPLIVYGKGTLKSFHQKTLEVLAELEKDYGPWPHGQVIVYGAGFGGGMEYCGATQTDFNALGHELTHSYFARGLMPAHGNAGWIDEAMASWRDGGYKDFDESHLNVTKMAGHSTYQRLTDRAAYSSGMRFLGHLHQKFKDQGGMKSFMRNFFEKNRFNPYLTPTFESELSSYFNFNFGPLFSHYIYGTGLNENILLPNKSFKSFSPMHRILSKEEQLDLL